MENFIILGLKLYTMETKTTIKKKSYTQSEVNKMTIWERIRTPAPKFFKRLSYVGAGLAAVTAPFIIIPGANPKFILLCTYLNAIGLAIVAVSNLTVDHSVKK